VRRRRWTQRREGDVLLSRRGFITTTFTGNLPDYDTVAVDEAGGHALVQVKAIEKSSWQFSDARRYVEVASKRMGVRYSVSRRLNRILISCASLSNCIALGRDRCDGLSVRETRLGKLHAVWLNIPNKEWARRNVAPWSKASADAMLSGEPVVTLEFEIVGERDVLDVTFVDGVPVTSDIH
jgi:hypothetical protein